MDVRARCFQAFIFFYSWALCVGKKEVMRILEAELDGERNLASVLDNVKFDTCLRSVWLTPESDNMLCIVKPTTTSLCCVVFGGRARFIVIRLFEYRKRNALRIYGEMTGCVCVCGGGGCIRARDKIGCHQ